MLSATDDPTGRHLKPVYANSLAEALLLQRGQGDPESRALSVKLHRYTLDQRSSKQHAE
jgi:hypothetical protein